MAKRASRAEYFRQYYPQRKLREAVRAKLAVDPVCQVCNWQFATVYWGARAIHSCEDCATKLSEWDMTWRPKAEAAAQSYTRPLGRPEGRSYFRERAGRRVGRARGAG